MIWLSDLTSDLRKLLKKAILFQLPDSHENDLQELNNNISIDACLQYNNPSKPVMLQVDVFQRELEAVHTQKDSESKDKPAVNVSKSLTPPETRYVYIEWEMSVVV